MKSEILLMRRAATIAANTRCWIGIGCVVAKGGKVLVEAWNETLEGERYCNVFRVQRSEIRALKGRTFPGKVRPYRTNEGCIRYELRLTQGAEIEKACSIHAEANAIAKAARKGISLDGAMMFVTSYPCLICMRAIVAVGIKKVVYMNDFYKPHDMKLFKESGIKIEQITEDIVWS